MFVAQFTTAKKIDYFPGFSWIYFWSFTYMTNICQLVIARLNVNIVLNSKLPVFDVALTV